MHDKNIKEYSYSNDTGDAQAVVYHVFPGIEIAYTTVHMDDFDFGLFDYFQPGANKSSVPIHLAASVIVTAPIILLFIMSLFWGKQDEF